jgi:hypothetical protein
MSEYFSCFSIAANILWMNWTLDIKCSLKVLIEYFCLVLMCSRLDTRCALLTRHLLTNHRKRVHPIIELGIDSSSLSLFLYPTPQSLSIFWHCLTNETAESFKLKTVIDKFHITQAKAVRESFRSKTKFPRIHLKPTFVALHYS